MLNTVFYTYDNAIQYAQKQQLKGYFVRFNKIINDNTIVYEIETEPTNNRKIKKIQFISIFERTKRIFYYPSVMVSIPIKDILNNIGCPNLADKIQLNHEDIEQIEKQIKEFTFYYGETFTNHETFKKATQILKQLKNVKEI